MSDLIEPVGARLTLLNGPAFRAGLAAATDALQAFNDEQARAAELADASQESIAAASKESSATVVDSSAVAADAVKAQAAATVEASDVIVGAADDAAVGVSAANAKIAGSATAAAAETKTAWTSAVATSTKILKYATVIGAAVVYEGVKKYMSFQQQIAQLAISAGVSKSQLPAFTKMAIAVSDATGMAAVSVGDMMYRIASANPKIKMTTQSMEDMVTQAGNLAVLTSTGSPNAVADTTARLYGAIVSNAMALTRGGPALSYTTAGGKAINEWVLAAAGHGDIKPAQLVAAMGTGILPVSKTFGLSLNDVGAMLDVLTPAMGAQQASTRLKTAIGMLGAPSQKAVDAAELVGGNATTMGGLLRTGGPTALMNYLANLQNKAMTGASFIGGGIYGAESGKYSGISGAADFLKSLGYTNAGLVSLLQTQGISGLKSMTGAQLQGLGFNAGMTGTQAAATVSAELIGAMFGGGRTGAAIMQLVNERGVLAGKEQLISGAETPKSYGQALSLAFAEPIVTFHKFESQLANLTIQVGKDVTPALDHFMDALLKIGSWFSKNKWALDALGVAAGTLVAGAAVVKTVSVAEKLGTGVINIGKFLLTGSWTSAGTSLTGAAAKLSLAGGSLQTAADRMLGTGAAGGAAVVEEEEGGALTFGTVMARAAGPIIGVAVAYVLANYLSKKYSKDVPSWLGFLSDQSLKQDWNDLFKSGASNLNKLPTEIRVPYGRLTPAQRVTVNQLQRSAKAHAAAALGVANAASVAAALSGTGTNAPTIAAVMGTAPAGGWLAARNAQFPTYPVAKAPTIASVAGTAPVGGWASIQHAQFAESRLLGVPPSAVANVQVDLSAAAKTYAITADSLKKASDDQKTAADKTNTGAETLQDASEQMLLAAQRWMAGAGLISSALSPGNIHALAVAGTKGSVARK